MDLKVENELLRKRLAHQNSQQELPISIFAGKGSVVKGGLYL